MVEYPIEPDGANARLIASKLHVNRAHASASQSKRILTDCDDVGTTALRVTGSLADGRGVCAAFDDALHLPVAGTSPVSAFIEEAQADLLFFLIFQARPMLGICFRITRCW